jgi:hypothetical protein
MSHMKSQNKFKKLEKREKFAIFISLFILLVGVFPIRAEAAELNVNGATLSWSDTMYKSDGCSRYNFEYFNGSGIRLLKLEMVITDPYGRKVADSSKIGIDPNLRGTFTPQICESQFTAGLGPYTVELSIEDYAGSTRRGTKNFVFLAIPGTSSGGSSSGGIGATPAPTVTVTARPSPGPTVTVTATPAPAPTVTVTASSAPVIDPYFKNEATRLQGELTLLKSEFNVLKAKLTKICKVKPKPKFC